MIALKAIVLNLLSVGAAYGFLVAVFQWGWGQHLLGFQSNGGITAWIPLFLLVVLFGLSMDYHVFILSRIREAVDRGMSTEQAVSRSLKTTAGVITSAAIRHGVRLLDLRQPVPGLDEGNRHRPRVRRSA